MDKSKILTAPPAVSLPKLRTHFRDRYQLNEEQVELMIRSSKMSLDTTLGAAVEAMASGDPLPGIIKAAHNLKGLFLNMGEQEWSRFCKTIELGATRDEWLDYQALFHAVKLGVKAVTDYIPESNT